MTDLRPKTIDRLPTLEEFVALRADTAWPLPSITAAQCALDNSLMGIMIQLSARQDDIIGMARIIGDGGLNIYVQDVIVAKPYRGQGHGRMLLQAIIVGMAQRFDPNITVGLMAASGQSLLYERAGFLPRPSIAFGPGMSAPLRVLSQALPSGLSATAVGAPLSKTAKTP